MKIQIEAFLPEEGKTLASELLSQHAEQLEQEASYAQMIRYRVAGKAAALCRDTYYIARTPDPESRFVSRLWHGWGRHGDAIGNFGNFFTLEEDRGKGVGKQMLEYWYEDLKRQKDAPLAFFCSAGKENLVALYGRYGFRLAVENTVVGPLYLPWGDRPADFREFCEEYYTPADRLEAIPATVEWRHEIDCLLRFALRREGEKISLGDFVNLEQVLMQAPKTPAVIYRIPNGHAVGWGITADKGRERVVHPRYRKLLRELEGEKLL